jgi:hypothetical protein
LPALPESRFELTNRLEHSKEIRRRKALATRLELARACSDRSAARAAETIGQLRAQRSAEAGEEE